MDCIGMLSKRRCHFENPIAKVALVSVLWTLAVPLLVTKGFVDKMRGSRAKETVDFVLTPLSALATTAGFHVGCRTSPRLEKLGRVAWPTKLPARATDVPGLVSLHVHLARVEVSGQRSPGKAPVAHFAPDHWTVLFLVAMIATPLTRCVPFSHVTIAQVVVGVQSFIFSKAFSTHFAPDNRAVVEVMIIITTSHAGVVSSATVVAHGARDPTDITYQKRFQISTW